ncbi:MAG TPA: MMPL family transporter, partial [Acidimicrobiales bacterium]|nr:MMPL family transporter [Acidimicrobiales bacterium]
MTSTLPTARSDENPTPGPTQRPPPSSTSDGRRRRGPSRPRRPSLLARLGGWSFDHRKAAVGAWFAALVVVLAAAGAIGAAYDASPDVPDSESADGFDALARYFPELGAGGATGTIVFRADQGIDDPAVTAAMGELFADVNAGFPNEKGSPQHPGATVVSPYTAQGESQISRDGPLAGQLAYAQVNMTADVGLTESAALGTAIFDAAPTIDGLTVLPGGTALAVFEPPKTEFIGLAFAILVLILAFGSVLAMGLPIAVALGGVGAGLGLIVTLSNVVDIPDFTSFLGAMIGLGVGIDYALFIVTRYREGIHSGRLPREATVTAMDTAGRAVIFAGVTVVVSLLGLLLIGIGWVAGLGIGVAVTVLATMITSILLLPALLGFAQERVEITRWRGLIAAGFVAVALFGVGVGFPAVSAVGAGLAALTMLLSFALRPLRETVPRRRARPVRQSLAYRWSRTIQRRPWLWVVAGTMLLLTLAAPVFGLRLGFSDDGNLAEDTYSRQAYDLLAEGFGPGFNGPFLITVVPGDGDSSAALASLERALAESPGVAAVSPAFPNRETAPEAYLLNVVPETAPQDAATTKLVKTLRGDIIPAAIAGTTLDAKVTGTAAANIDFTSFLAGRIPIFFGAVLALSFLLLMVVFRSLLVPLKAVVMNVLSIGATYGVLVVVFQWGWGAGLIGIDTGPIEAIIPLMLFAIIFGLSMDYEVFLLSRVREEYDKTRDSALAVADGLAKTAQVITAAAAIMVVVFGSFVFEDSRTGKLFGIGFALAVLLDATIVRMLLVPATMELLGDKNWWMPA